MSRVRPRLRATSSVPELPPEAVAEIMQYAGTPTRTRMAGASRLFRALAHAEGLTPAEEAGWAEFRQQVGDPEAPLEQYLAFDELKRHINMKHPRAVAGVDYAAALRRLRKLGPVPGKDSAYYARVLADISDVPGDADLYAALQYDLYEQALDHAALQTSMGFVQPGLGLLTREQTPFTGLVDWFAVYLFAYSTAERAYHQPALARLAKRGEALARLIAVPHFGAIAPGTFTEPVDADIYVFYHGLGDGHGHADNRLGSGVAYKDAFTRAALFGTPAALGRLLELARERGVAPAAWGAIAANIARRRLTFEDGFLRWQLIAAFLDAGYPEIRGPFRGGNSDVDWYHLLEADNTRDHNELWARGVPLVPYTRARAEAYARAAANAAIPPIAVLKKGGPRRMELRAIARLGMHPAAHRWLLEHGDSAEGLAAADEAFAFLAAEYGTAAGQ